MPHHIFDHNRGWRRIWAGLAAVLLLCAPVLAASGKSAADYYVRDMPGAPDGPLLKMHAGHIEVAPKSHGNLFFWHFQNRHIGDKQRTVLWLNGGPGCSSLDGALMEIGPYRVGEGGKLSYNNGSWDEFANLLFLDQPVGTGFSYVDTNAYLHELDEMADHVVEFLSKFMALFPEYANDDIYIAGESYAGQFIPYIARAILKHNKESTGRLKFNLQGLLIGNGWISPKEQYESYTKFAYQMGVLKQDTSAATAVETQLALCSAELNAGNRHINIDPCEQVLLSILEETQDPHGHEAKDVCVNMYDVRLRDSSPSCGMNWPPDLEHITPYTRRDDVKRALHVDAQNQIAWTECSGSVGRAFNARNSSASIDLLPELIEQVPVVLFSGDQDLICNHLGTEALIHNMDWNGGKGFELPNAPGTWAPRQDWTFEGEPAGFYQEARNLTYVLFYNASHMVPFDYPRRTRDMLDRFMGVDISSIGGEPSDSRLDGEKSPSTSVGGHPNSTAAEEATKGKLKQAAVNAYYKSGEVVLVLLLLGLAVWGTWYWRTKRRSAGYLGLGGGRGGRGGGDDYGDGSASRMLKRMSHAVLQSPAGATSFRDRIPTMHERGPRLEAADFDENELADLTSPRAGGADSDDEGEGHRLNGGGLKGQ